MRRLPVLCPSSQMEASGAHVLGVVNALGRAEMLEVTVPVTSEFIEASRKGRDPGKRFRFASYCSGKQCVEWSKGRCGVADAAVEELGGNDGENVEHEAHCPIRESCRWFKQSAWAACKVCPQIVTNMFVES
jgi:hypothetical protein